MAFIFMHYGGTQGPILILKKKTKSDELRNKTESQFWKKIESRKKKKKTESEFQINEESHFRNKTESYLHQIIKSITTI